MKVPAINVKDLQRGEENEILSFFGLPLASASKESSATPSSGPQSPARNALAIGLVGKMASGKNYVCSLLEKKGWASIDADLLVHKAIKMATPQIIETFSPTATAEGITITKEDGSINRRSLGTILFKYPELMEKQENIVYPIITKMIYDFMETHEKTIINATVLYKTPELVKLCKGIVFVQSNSIKRFFRAKKRDKMPAKQILKRFKSQKDLFKKYAELNIPLLIVKN